MARQFDVQYVRFYTDGSAAKQVNPVAPLKTIKLPKVKKHKRLVIAIDPVAIMGIVMAAVMLVLMTVGVVQLNNSRKELQTMTEYVEALQEEKVSLEQTFSQGYDLEEIQRTALALGLVPKEQVQHITIRVPEAQTEEEPGAWERLYIFLTGLFA
ncbi:MAG: hypothetical protein IKC95_02740 [Oscillospiraceae bacterium]|nr:hypothetical protein [Oscillospiraceae bacterium]